MIGMSCTHFCSLPLSHWAPKVAETFDHWEIFSEVDHSILGREAEVSELLDQYDLSCSVHAPICDLNISAFSDRLREASVKEIIATISSSSEIGAKTVTVHPGLSSMSVSGTEERAEAICARALKVVDKAAREFGMTVAVENMPAFPFFLGRTAESLSRMIDGTDLSVCFDIGHANTTGQIDAMVETFGDRIANIHIHDNHGQRDEHLTIGEGAIDFDHVLSLLSGYRGNHIIESKNLESAVESHSRLEKMLS